MEKRVTKKLVGEALAPFNGWNYSYRFKEEPAIYIFLGAKSEDMITALSAHGITVTEYTPYKREERRTGNMKLAMKESPS